MHVKAVAIHGTMRKPNILESLRPPPQAVAERPVWRTTFALVAAAAVVLLAIGGVAGGIAPAEAAEPMSFQTETITSPVQCRRHCLGIATAEIISATGEITTSTADEFASFLMEHVQDGQLRPVVLIHSPGGSVVGAMKLGETFRKLGAAVIVARSMQDDAGRTHVVPGSCMSACVYAFFGGEKRVVPESSRLGIHRMAIFATAHNPAGGSETTRTFGTTDIVTALSDYTREMGINPAVIEFAEQVAPETIHIMTPAEMARWHVGVSHL